MNGPTPDGVEVNDTAVPAHEAVGEAEADASTLTTFTVTVCAELVHPAALVAVTEYVVLAEGDTVTVDPVKFPGVHE